MVQSATEAIVRGQRGRGSARSEPGMSLWYYLRNNQWSWLGGWSQTVASFGRPTRAAESPSVEAPIELLQGQATLGGNRVRGLTCNISRYIVICLNRR